MKIIITISYQFYSESVWFLKPFCHCASPPHFWIFLSFLWCHFSICNYTTIIRKPWSYINKFPYLKNKSLKVWGGNPLTNCHHIIKYHFDGYNLHYIVHYLCRVHVNLVCSKSPIHLDRSFFKSSASLHFKPHTYVNNNTYLHKTSSTLLKIQHNRN